MAVLRNGGAQEVSGGSGRQQPSGDLSKLDAPTAAAVGSGGLRIPKTGTLTAADTGREQATAIVRGPAPVW